MCGTAAPTIPPRCQPPPPPSASRTSTSATTTSRPRHTTPSGGSTSAESARIRCSTSCARRSGARISAAILRRARDRRGNRLLHAQPAAGRGRSNRATATDISPGMLEALRPTRSAWASRSTTVATEAESLPFDDASFDLVFGHAVLHHIPDLAQGLRASSTACCAPAGRRRVLRRALALRRPDRRRPQARGPAGRTAMAPRDRRLRARLLRRRRGRPTATPSSPRSTSTPSAPAICATSSRQPASATSASRARSCSPTCTGGRCARSRRPLSRTRSPRAGAGSPSAATWPCRGSTARCWSPACRPRLFYNLVLSGFKAEA